MPTLPDCFYRISVKALILDDQKRFLLMQEEDGRWELPGGGLDFGETVEEAIQRELWEEMRIKTTFIAKDPSYFFTFFGKSDNCWKASVVYGVQLEHLQFTSPSECQNIGFFDKEEAEKLPIKKHVRKFIEQFDPEKHP